MRTKAGPLSGPACLRFPRTLHSSLVRADDFWVAQGIEIGVVAQGSTPEGAYTVLVEVLIDYIACAERLAQAREGRVSPYGTALAAILPPISRFTPDRRYGATKQRVLARLTALVAQEVGQTAPTGV